MAQAQQNKLQGHRDFRSKRQRCTLPDARASCGKLQWPALPLRPRLIARLPSEQPTSLHLLVVFIILDRCSQRCNAPCAEMTHTQHSRCSGSSACPCVNLAVSCGVSSRQLHRASKCIARKRKEKKRKEKKRKEKKRKEYAFRRQFNEKPSSIPCCPGKCIAEWLWHVT